MPTQYQSDPMVATKPMPVSMNKPAVVAQPAQANALQQTPGGLYGNINANRYPVSGTTSNSSSNWAAAQNPHPVNTNPASNQNATQWNTNYGAIDTGVDAFKEFENNAYAAAMRQMQPQMEAQQRGIEQSLVSRGLQPGSAAYNAELDRMTRGQNDMLQSAAFGAQQAGLQAQNQYFNQEAQNQQLGMAQANQNYGQQFGYDQLANALAQSRLGANATLGAASASAAASRYGADLRNQLAMNQLNENARQFDANNILATNGQNQNFMLGALGQYNNMMNTGINQFNAQQGANNNWYNQNAGFISNAPGINFTPNTGYTNSQIQANQNHMGAIGADNQMAASMMGGAFSMFSDKRLKTNIEKVERVNGVNVYEFDYIDKSLGDGRYRGVMAQEVEHKYPDAVREFDGFKVVDYSKLPVDMERVS